MGQGVEAPLAAGQVLHANDLPRPYVAEDVTKSGHQRPERLNLDAIRDERDDAEAHAGKVLLSGKTTIHRHEDIKLSCGNSKKFAVLLSRPGHFANGPDFVTG